MAQASLPSAHAQGTDVDWGSHHDWLWNGQQCHWRHLGDPDGPPLVLIHGFAAGCGHWRRNAIPFAAAGWSVYGLDLIGFGASSQPGALRLDNRLWARQLNGFLEEVIQRPAVLVGHSLGGLVALTCSVFFPDQVLAVIAAPLPDPTLLMVDPRNGTENVRRAPWKRQARRRLVETLCHLLPLEVVVPVLAHTPLLDLAIQSAYSAPILKDRELHRVLGRPARRRTAARSLRAMSVAMALRPGRATAPSLLRRQIRPTHLIWGEQDLLVPVQVGWQCQRFRKDLVVTLIDGAGHCPHDEQADAFNSVVNRWLHQLEIPKSGRKNRT